MGVKGDDGKIGAPGSIGPRGWYLYQWVWFYEFIIIAFNNYNTK